MTNRNLIRTMKRSVGILILSDKVIAASNLLEIQGYIDIPKCRDIASSEIERQSRAIQMVADALSDLKEEEF